MSSRSLTRTPTTIASWAKLIARTLDSCGVDGKAVFAEAGLDLDEARDPNARFPVPKMSRVWQLAVEKTGDPCIALRLPEFFQPAMYGPLGLSLMSSSNFAEVLYRTIRYHRVTSDAVTLRLEERGEYCDLIYEVPPESRDVAGEALEAFIATSFVLNGSLAGDKVSPLEVHFTHAKSGGAERYRAFFCAPVFFESTANKVVFARKQLDRECVSANPAIAATLDNWMREYLEKLDSPSLAARIQGYLFENLASGEISQAQLARDLGMSLRALQRRLQEEGHRYKELLEHTRHDLALKYLADPDLTLAEITYLLGFSDQSNFTRAFRRWTDCSPQQYRSKRLR